jgi:hypothetical protein
MEQLFPVHAVAAGKSARPLPRAGTVPDWPFVQPYLDSHAATGLLVMKDGQVLLERYQYGRNAEHRFTSFSMAKTVVAMAFGGWRWPMAASRRSTIRSSATSPHWPTARGREWRCAMC